MSSLIVSILKQNLFFYIYIAWAYSFSKGRGRGSKPHNRHPTLLVRAWCFNMVAYFYLAEDHSVTLDRFLSRRDEVRFGRGLPSELKICSSPVWKSRDMGPVPYPNFLRPESYRSYQWLQARRKHRSVKPVAGMGVIVITDTVPTSRSLLYMVRVIISIFFSSQENL